eukprot:6969485-Prymnesium_polylepis.1
MRHATPTFSSGSHCVQMLLAAALPARCGRLPVLGCTCSGRTRTPVSAARTPQAPRRVYFTWSPASKFS